MSDREIYTVGWICALGIEYFAARAFLDAEHDPPDFVPDEDKNEYTLGRIAALNVVIAAPSAGQHKKVSATTAARYMRHSFPNVRICLIVGIGGGAPTTHDIRLGDVVVSKRWDSTPGLLQYDFENAIQHQKFDITSTTEFRYSTVLEAALSILKYQTERCANKLQDSINRVLDRQPNIRKRYGRPPQATDVLYKSNIVHSNSMAACQMACNSDLSNVIQRLERTHNEDNPAIHYGLIASSDQAMKDALVRDKLASEHDVLCFETEAVGWKNEFPSIIIRGICDYSDSHRNKEWQSYAAIAAAACARELLEYTEELPVLSFEDKLEMVIDNLSETVEGVTTFQSNSSQENDLTILEKIAGIDYRAQQNDNFELHQSGTGKWLLDSIEYKRWLDTPGITLFCTGIPGTGKTILTSVVVHDLYTKKLSAKFKIGIAYIYCHFNRHEEQTVDALLSSLLKQLCQQLPALPTKVKEAYEGKIRPSLNETVEIIQFVVEKYLRVFIIIDALDELQESDGSREIFLTYISTIHARTKMNIFATARPPLDIKSNFSNRINIKLGGLAQNEEALRLFIESRAQTLGLLGLKENKDGLLDEIKSFIVNSANGSFLLARVYVDDIMRRSSLASVKRALKAHKERFELSKKEGKDFGPESIELEYDGIMRRIIEQAPDTQKRLAIDVLSWVYCTVQPFSSVELQKALAVEPGSCNFDNDNLIDIEDLLSACYGLIVFDNDRDIVRFCHHSAKFYFDMYHGLWIPNAQTYTTATCITYLSFDHLVEDSAIPGSLQHPVTLDPFYRYAALNWGYHAKKIGSLSEELLRFVRSETKTNSAGRLILELDICKCEENANLLKYMDPDSPVTGLHLAAFFGLNRLVEILAGEYENIDIHDCLGLSPLHYAAYNGHRKVIQILIERGANINHRDNSGTRTALIFAIMRNHTAAVGLLFEQKDDLEIDGTAFKWAIRQGDAKLVEDMLLRGAGVGDEVNHRQDPSTKPPLMWAIEKHQYTILKLLLSYGADIEGRDIEGATPLICAVQRNSLPGIRLLTEAGANLNRSDNNGVTPLIYAVQGNSFEGTRLLIEAGADLAISDNNGITPLLCAMKASNQTLIRLLVERTTQQEQGKPPKFVKSRRDDDQRIELHESVDLRSAADTDSGYASMKEQNDNTPSIAQPGLPTVIELEDDDNDSICSDTSSIVDSMTRKSHASELADALFEKVIIDRPDTSNLERSIAALSSLLKAFALKIGYNAQVQTHRDVMVFIRKHRGDIVGRFKERCAIYKSEASPDVRRTDSNQMAFGEKVDSWLERPDVATDSLDMSELPEPTSESEEDVDDSNQSTEVDSQALIYRDLIFNCPAYEWLVERLRLESLLTPMEPNSIETIKATIIRSLPSSDRFSKNRPAEAFKGVFRTNWKPLKFLEEQNYGNTRPGDAIENAITITGSEEDGEALTCAQYLRKTWPSTGEHIIKIIKDVLNEESQVSQLRRMPDNTDIKAYIRESSELVVEALGTADSIAEIGQQTAWISTALRTSSGGIVSGIPSIKVLPTTESCEVLFTAAPSGLPDFIDSASNLPVISYEIGFNIEEKKTPYILSNAQCWHNLFRNRVVVKGYPVSQRLTRKTGLEIPLNIMAGLLRTQHVQVFDEKIFIKSFSALLVPAKRYADENMIIWHLIYNENGRRISYLDNSGPHTEGLSFSELETSRHVVGWCPKAQYYAGAAGAEYRTGGSGLPRPHQGRLLSGVYIRGRRIIKEGIPFNTGQADIALLISQEDPIQRLEWLDQKRFVFWDKEEKRGWLVNGTSTLLHLLRKSLRENKSGKFSFELRLQDDKALEEPEDYTAASAPQVLLNSDNLKQEIRRSKDGYYRIEDRLEELSDILEKLVDYQFHVNSNQVTKKINGGKYLEGWDFFDLAIKRDPMYPRVMKLEKNIRSGGWFDFTRNIGAVFLFGCGFGEVIKPKGTYACSKWATLPKQKYYLAAVVDDLTDLIQQNGGYFAKPLRLSDDTIFHIPKASFGECECKGEEGVERHSELVQVLLSPKLYPKPPLESSVLLEGGAVIFGHNEELEWSWENIVDIEEDDGSFSVTEDSEILSLDSGIGSSLGSRSCDDYRIGIVCALPKELLAVCVLFDFKHDDLSYPEEDDNSYSLGMIHGQNVVAAGLPSGEYGTCSATSVLKDMKRTFTKLKLCLLVGIGGGAPSDKNDIRLGDVVVSHQGVFEDRRHSGVIQYDFGKALDNGIFKETGMLRPPPTFIMTKISTLKTQPEKCSYQLERDLEIIATKHPEYAHPGPEQDPLLTSRSTNPRTQARPQPKVHYGLIASANTVMKDAKRRDELASRHNILCFEMEAAGTMNVADCLVIRGICDYSDSQKNKIWQEYAAAVAAAYMKLLISYIGNQKSSESRK